MLTMLTEILPIPHFDCAFENQYGYVKTAGYELKFERFENNTRCILNGTHQACITCNITSSRRKRILRHRFCLRFANF